MALITTDWTRSKWVGWDGILAWAGSAPVPTALTSGQDWDLLGRALLTTMWGTVGEVCQ